MKKRLKVVALKPGGGSRSALVDVRKKFYTKFNGWAVLVIATLSLNGGSAFGKQRDIKDIVVNLSECHPELLSYRSRVLGAESAKDETRADRLPTFSISASSFADDNGGEDTQANLTATLPIATFGRQAINERVSEMRLKLVEAEYAQRIAEHMKELVGLWTKRVVTLRRIEIFEESLVSKQDFVDVIERRAEQGVSSDAELRDARSEYLADVTDVEDLRLQLLDVEAGITELSCDNVEILSVVWKDLPIQVADLKVESHPDLVLSRQRLKVAEGEAELSAVSRNPTLQLEGRVTSNEFKDVSTRIGLSFDYEYENLGRSRKAENSQADMEVREAEYLFKAERRDIEQQLETSFQRLRQLNDKFVPALQDQLLNFRTAMDSSQRLYSAGRMTAREVLSDINSVKQTRLDLADTLSQSWSIYNDLAYASNIYAN